MTYQTTRYRDEAITRYARTGTEAIDPDIVWRDREVNQDKLNAERRAVMKVD